MQTETCVCMCWKCFDVQMCELVNHGMRLA